MSPPARSLLALAAACAAIIHIDAHYNDHIGHRHHDDEHIGHRHHDDDHIAHRYHDNEHCTVVEDGRAALHYERWRKHIVEKSSVVPVEVPCTDADTNVVGKNVKVCDPVGPPPDVTLVDGGKRARVVCKRNSEGSLCPEGLDMDVLQFCGYF